MKYITLLVALSTVDAFTLKVQSDDTLVPVTDTEAEDLAPPTDEEIDGFHIEDFPDMIEGEEAEAIEAIIEEEEAAEEEAAEEAGEGQTEETPAAEPSCNWWCNTQKEWHKMVDGISRANGKAKQ